MYLYLPDRLFFEKEIYCKMIQQNSCGLNWTIQVSINDPGSNIRMFGQRLNTTNYIVLTIHNRTDRTIGVDVTLVYDDNIMYQNTYDIELLFEENALNVGMYRPKLEHFNKNSPEFKLNLINLGDTDPICKVGSQNWDGFQSVGLIYSGNAIVEIPINNFAPNNTTWNYAVVRGHWLGDGTNIVHRTNDNVVKPITFTHRNREIEIVMRPGEKLIYSNETTNNGQSNLTGFGGFGITSIYFYKK